MKCKIIKTPLPMGFKEVDKVEEHVNAWLQANPNVKIISVSQVSLGTNTVLTTILHE